MKETKELKMWNCKNCKSTASTSDNKAEYGNVVELINAAMKSALGNLTNEIAQLKAQNEILVTQVSQQTEMIRELQMQTSTINKCQNLPQTESFADKVKKADPVVIIRPNTKQNNKETRCDVKNAFNPTDAAILNLKNARSGAVIVECKNKKAAEQLASQAKCKLGNKYAVEEPNKKLPRIKIVNMDEQFEPEELEARIRAQNNDIVSTKSKLNVLDIKNGKYKDTFMAYIEIDGETFESVLRAGFLSIGWKRCRVFDAINVIRCFKCNKFNHKAADCKGNITCSKCSGPHDTKACEIDSFTCSNCKFAVEKLKMKIDTNHPAWSRECPVYRKKLEMQQKKTNFLCQP